MGSGGSWGVPARGHPVGTPWAAGRAGEQGQVCSRWCVFTLLPSEMAPMWGARSCSLHRALGNVNVYKAVCSWPGHHGHRKPRILLALVPPPQKRREMQCS